MHYFGGLAQLARAPALHAGGQRFESVILHSLYDRRLTSCEVSRFVYILMCCGFASSSLASVSLGGKVLLARGIVLHLGRGYMSPLLASGTL